jgi:nucleoporin GLE1
LLTLPFQVLELRQVFVQASKASEPMVDVRDYLAFPPDHIAQSDDVHFPAMVIYLLNIFSKAAISQLINEAGINPKYAEPIGILAAQIFSLDGVSHKGYAMSDILWAKFRVVCPALWGFYGNETTEAGKIANGWPRVEPGGRFVKDQIYADRMSGLGAGFAAITLRNFGRSALQNPFPNPLFWNAVHKIVTVPADEVQNTHFLLLTAMLRTSGERIILFFGHVGLAMMRQAIVDFPARVSKQSTAGAMLQLLRDLYKRDKNIIF